MTATPTSGAADLPEALHRVIDDFERRERGIPQAHIAAALVTELRAALTARATAAQAGAPANMQVTEKMRAAGDCAWMTADRVDSARVFRAMLAAAPAQPDQPIACSYGDNGYACCEGGPCQADVHNDKLAEQPAPAGAVLPAGWVPLTITLEGQFSEEVAYGPQIMMDRLGKWLGKYFAQAADSVTAPAPPPECETEAEKRAFAFGWFKALESERMKADNKKKDPL